MKRKSMSKTDRLMACQVGPQQSLLQAMAAVDAGAAGMALVVDRQGVLLGVLTDGDLRRALLRGAGLESPIRPHIQREFLSVPPSARRTEVLDLMQARMVRQVPVVDERGRLAGLHLLHELVGAVERPNAAVIMAGGKGTRLWPLTETLPKPMIKVAGRPILERLLLHLVGCGLRDIYISINYLGHLIEQHFGDGSRFGCRIEYLREKKPLGTGGCLSMLPAMKHPVLVMNGDLLTQVNLSALLDYHRTGRFAATLGMLRYSHEVPFGCIEVRKGRVVKLEEKPVLARSINAGIYVFDPEVVARVPRRTYDITDLIGDCLARKERVAAYAIEDEWLDIGHRDTLRQAQGR